MEDSDDRFCPLRGLFDKPDQFVLVMEIDMGKRFIQEEEVGILCKDTGNQNPLPFPSAERGDGTGGKCQSSGLLKGRPDNGMIHLGRLPEPGDMGISPHHHDVIHRVCKRDLALLGNQSNLFSKLPVRYRVRIRPSEKNNT